MAQVTWTANKDATTADNGTSMGCGAQNYLPVGNYQGYNYRAMLNFSYGNFSQIASVQSAVLWMKTSDQGKVGFGSSPSIDFYRIVTAFIEGTNTSLSASPSPSGAVERSNEGSTGTHAGPFGVTQTQNKWVSFDITNIVQAMVANNWFVGLQIRPTTSGSGDVTEFWSREGGAAPYIVVNYTPPVTNVVPNAPTGLGSTGGMNPVFTFDHSDPDGDALATYDIQVSEDGNFGQVTDWNVAGSAVGVSGGHVSVVYGGVALRRGVSHYWRVRTASGTGTAGNGQWANGPSWVAPTAPPSVSPVSPSSSGAAVEMSYVVESGLPKAVIRWAFSDPGGAGQAYWQVAVYTDAGALIRDSFKQSGAASSYTVPDDLTRNTNYRVIVTVWNVSGDTAVLNWYQFRPQWAVVSYRLDTGGPVTSWSATPSSTAGANKMVVTEYGSSADGSPPTWYGSLSSAGLNRWFHWRVWLFAWAGATSPTFDRMALVYSTSVGVPPDGWTVDAQCAIDTGAHVYGTQSLRITGDGGVHIAFQSVPVQKNTDYILSGRVKSDGNSGAQMQIVNAAGTQVVAQSPIVGASLLDFARIQTPVWNSGDNEVCRIHVAVVGAAGTKAWFDALKLEASRVVTSWNPGMVGAGVSVDAGGIKVDASPRGQASFRMQGSDGLLRSIVELGTKGLLFGGDTLLHAPFAGSIAVGDDAVRAGVLALSGGPSGFEGGQLDILGAAALTDWHIDNYQGGLRMFDTAVRLAVNSSSPHVSVGGDLAVSGAASLAAATLSGLLTANGNINAHQIYFDGDGGTTLFRVGASTAKFAGSLEVGGYVNGSSAIYESGVRLIQPAGLRILYGQSTTTHSANVLSAVLTVAFATAFSANPVVVGVSNSSLYAATGFGTTTGNFTVQTRRLDGSAPSGGVVVVWIAIGPA